MGVNSRGCATLRVLHRKPDVTGTNWAPDAAAAAPSTSITSVPRAVVLSPGLQVHRELFAAHYNPDVTAPREHVLQQSLDLRLQPERLAKPSPRCNKRSRCQNGAGARGAGLLSLLVPGRAAQNAKMLSSKTAPTQQANKDSFDGSAVKVRASEKRFE